MGLSCPAVPSALQPACAAAGWLVSAPHPDVAPSRLRARPEHTAARRHSGVHTNHLSAFCAESPRASMLRVRAYLQQLAALSAAKPAFVVGRLFTTLPHSSTWGWCVAASSHPCSNASMALTLLTLLPPAVPAMVVVLLLLAAVVVLAPGPAAHGPHSKARHGHVLARAPHLLGPPLVDAVNATPTAPLR